MARAISRPLLLALLLASRAAMGEEFQVNTYTTDEQSFVDVAMNDAGQFLVVWDSEGASGSDQEDTSIQAQL